MDAAGSRALDICLELTRAIGRTRTAEEIYGIALDALEAGLGVTRSSILLFDPDGVMRFKAFRNLSEPYRRAVEGHTPWRPDSPDPQPIVVPDVTKDGSLAPYLSTIAAEGIAAMSFIPLVSGRVVIGKFMLYFDEPCALTRDELRLAEIIASQVAFAVERTQAEAQSRESEERLRFALDAASMGTWDWDQATQRVRWSDNLERIHGLPPGTFDGSFESYAAEIHPEDRERVLASVANAASSGAAHDVEYRIVSPDGTIRWVEGKGRMERRDGVAAHMTGVCMDVTRRKEAELARLAAVQEASRLKDEFLATLSHELRTPLNAVLGWVQMLQAGAVPPDRLSHAVEVIGRNARLQAQLIEDILDVSRAIAGKFDLERTLVSVPTLVSTVLSSASPSIVAKRIQVAKAVADDLPPIHGDFKRLVQILGNVLSNAVKFTPDGGQIQIDASASDSELQIRVTDNGIGIEPSFLPYVFDRFRQADSQSTRRHGGLGLGLAIARSLAEQHGGQIEAASDGVGRGTTVTIRLPIATGAVAAATSHRRQDASVDLRLDGSRVIVVDDQRDSRDLLAALLASCGAAVVTCDSAGAVMEALNAAPAALVVADIAMPDVDGYELMRQIHEKHALVPAVAVSAYARPEDRQRAFATGYGGYCAKPIDAVAFTRTIRDVLLQASLTSPAVTPAVAIGPRAS